MFNERDPRMMLQRRLNEEAVASSDSLPGDDGGCCTMFHEVSEPASTSTESRRSFVMRLAGSACEDSLSGDDRP